VFETAELREAVAKAYGAVEGLLQTMARLGEEVAKMAAGLRNGNEFVVTREFSAPCDLVFQVFRQHEHLAGWWEPKGFRIRIGFGRSCTRVNARNSECTGVAFGTLRLTMYRLILQPAVLRVARSTRLAKCCT